MIGLAYVLVSFFGIRTNVVGQAMEQTLENDDNILVNRFAYIMSKPKAGDVIVFLPNGNNKVALLCQESGSGAGRILFR